MRVWVLYGCFLLLSCGQEPKEPSVATTVTDTSAPVMVMDTLVDTTITNFSFAKEEPPAEELPPPMKRPDGIYRFLLPHKNNEKILHTVSFSSGTFRLQEEYGGKRDSIVITEGTWAPSTGYIWLYKEQVVRGRYTWQGDTLQYYSPQNKETFPMQKLQPVTGNELWQQKKADGALLYAIGTEPFWNVEITGQDTLIVNMPNWSAPLRVKVASGGFTNDSTVYTGAKDSVQVTVYPLFCHDGMSDFLYTQKVRMVYKGQTYQGCGERFRSAF